MQRTFKYKTGDCLSFSCPDKTFVAALITDIYKSYYDITFVEYRQKTKPGEINFKTGKFFGTRGGSTECVHYLADKCMIKKTLIDKSENVELVCSLNLVETLGKASYYYVNDIDGLIKHYVEELPIRKEKTRNADKFPEIGFMSKHLIDVKLVTRGP